MDKFSPKTFVSVVKSHQTVYAKSLRINAMNLDDAMNYDALVRISTQ